MLGLRQMKETERKAFLPNMPWNYPKANRTAFGTCNRYFPGNVIFSIYIDSLWNKRQMQIAIKGKSPSFLYVHLNKGQFYFKSQSWDDLFPLRHSLCFWRGWQGMTAELTALLAAEIGQAKAAVSPLNNELDFSMQPRFLQDKPWCDRWVVDEATQPRDFFCIQGLY